MVIVYQITNVCITKADKIQLVSPNCKLFQNFILYQKTGLNMNFKVFLCTNIYNYQI